MCLHFCALQRILINIYRGVVDWGRAYATVSFPTQEGRVILAGWTYEDDEQLVLAKQQGYQGAFTLFRELYSKIIPKVSNATSGLYDPGSWGVREEVDGSVSVMTVGQRVVNETLMAYKQSSLVTKLSPHNISSAGYAAFETQPTGRHYAM